MNIINNRYRVLSIIDKGQILTSLEVMDILRENSKLKLNVIDIKYLSKNMESYLKNEFVNLVNLSSKYMFKLYSLNVINTIDNRYVDEFKWYYTSELKYKWNNLYNVVKLNEKDIIDIFLQLCICIQYINSSGYIYENIIPENVYVMHDKNKFKVKLNNLIASELNETQQNSGWDFKFNRENQTGFYDGIKQEIYKLGILLMGLVRREFLDYLEKDNLLEVYKSISKGSYSKYYSSDFLSKILPIIYNMICSEDKRYRSIKNIVDDINYVFERDVNVYDVEALEKMNYNVSIVGRKAEIEKVLNAYGLSKNSTHKSNLFIVHGKSGIGKTRFLREIKYIFRFNMDSVYYSFDNGHDIKRIAFNEILKQILINCDFEHGTKSRERELALDLLNIFSNYDSKEILLNNEDKFKVFDMCIDFLNMMAVKKPLILLIDNIDEIDEFSIEFIKYFYSKVRSTKNILFIFSYSEEIEYRTNRTNELINLFKMNFTDIFLDELKFEDTNKFIKYVLGTRYLPESFCRKIFEKTKGNPGFIMEVLKGLYARKYIYVSKDKGLWITSYDKISEIPIHGSLIKNIENQIKGINGLELEFMNAFSIFNINLKMSIIEAFFEEYDKKTVYEVVNKLLDKGIIEKVDKNTGLYYAVTSKTIKLALIERMDNNYKNKINERAALILEKIDRDKYSEEILFHFENSFDVNKIIEYYLSKYKNPLYIKDRNLVVSKIRKLVKSITTNCSFGGIKLLIILGDLLLLDEKKDEAKIYFKLAEKLSEKMKNYDLQFKALNKIIFILQNNLNLTESKKYIYEQKKILKQYYRLEFKLCICLEEAFNFYNNKEFEKAIFICKGALKECNQDMEEEKFFAYYILSNSFIKKWDIRDAFKYTALCVDEKYISQNLTYVLNSLNNMAYIYENYFDDVDKAKKYLLQLLQLSTNFNYLHFKLLSLSQIATLDLKEAAYDGAFKSFENVLELAQKINDKFIEAYCYCKLCKVCLSTYDIGKAYKYFIKAAIKIAYFKNDADFINMYFMIAIELYLKIGQPKKAKAYMNKLKNKCGQDNISEIEKFIDYYIDYLTYKDEASIERFKAFVKKVDFKNKDINSIVEIVHLSITIYLNKDFELFYMIYNRLNKLDIKSSLVSREITVMKSLKAQGKERLSYSIRALNKNSNEVSLSNIVLYMNITEYYLKNKDYIRTINYFFNCIDIVWNYYINIPDQYKEDFINNYNLISFFKKYVDVINEYAGSEILVKDDFTYICDNNGTEKFYENTNLKKLFSMEKLKKDLKEYYLTCIPKKVNGRISVMKNQVNSSTINIENILRYLKYSLIAKNIYFVLNPVKNEDVRIFTEIGSFVDNNIFKKNWIIDNVNMRKNLIFIKRFGFKAEKNLRGGIKSIICIPIYRLLEDEYKKRSFRNVLGILYIDTDKILNNFNVDSINKCIQFNGLIGLNVEKYRLSISSSVDALTGAKTRGYLENSVEKILNESKEKQKEFSVFMYDLDNFKGINDRFGHGTGDKVLKEVSRIVMDNIGSKSICGRYGGEEFIVILPDLNVAKAYEISEIVRDKIDKAKILGDKRSVTISVGVVSYPDMANSKSEIFEKVDKALYMAKNSGRNRCVIWNERFNYKAKGTNKITGIITGNAVKDSRNVLVMVEFMEMLRDNDKMEKKIFSILGRLIEFFEATYCSFILLDNLSITKIYTRKIFEAEFVDSTYVNSRIIKDVLQKGIGMYMIDWDNISGIDEATGMPYWDSIMVIPLINKSISKGALYFKVPNKQKEFNVEEFNFASAISNIIAALL
ncbi:MULTISPECIES: diguanylate cyclase [Clostridium]|uniref:diguanylate cyclase n=1 Tax=Clostridium TaxID=1485 RepID=UPI0008270971|nr:MULTISPECIES: diguanylate cyclase [Clostridium]PJI09495.1 diguanylate cyclase [Clostridium sp. CT7]